MENQMKTYVQQEEAEGYGLRICLTVNMLLENHYILLVQGNVQSHPEINIDS